MILNGQLESWNHAHIEEKGTSFYARIWLWIIQHQIECILISKMYQNVVKKGLKQTVIQTLLLLFWGQK